MGGLSTPVAVPATPPEVAQLTTRVNVRSRVAEKNLIIGNYLI